MASNAFPVQLNENIRSARHKPGKFLDKFNLASSVLDVGTHEESAHVSLDDTNCRVFEDLVNALQVPGPRCPGMLVEEVPALFKLMSAQREANIDVLHGLGLLHLVPLEPTWLVLVCGFVELLQQAEVGAREETLSASRGTPHRFSSRLSSYSLPV